MKKLIKLNVILLIFSLFFTSQSVLAAHKILPLPKPVVDKQTKEITAKKKNNIS